jgi:hypothetical protein
VTFTEAVKALITGKRITRKEWADKRHYGLLSDYILHIHKAGEAEADIHPWILSESDLVEEDWEVLDE